MSKFYHTIGYIDRNGKQHFKLGYRLEMFWYDLRQLIALMIMPEFREKRNACRYNMDFVYRLRQEHLKEVRARDKAINRLQKKVRGLHQAIREQDGKETLLH